MNLRNLNKFIFYIPITPMVQTVEEDFHIQPTEAEIVSQSDERVENLEQNTLLIVEDNQDLRLFLSDSLKKEYHVLFCGRRTTCIIYSQERAY